MRELAPAVIPTGAPIRELTSIPTGAPMRELAPAVIPTGAPIRELSPIFLAPLQGYAGISQHKQVDSELKTIANNIDPETGAPIRELTSIPTGAPMRDLAPAVIPTRAPRSL